VAAGWFPELAAAMRSSRTSGETKSLLLVADAWPSRLRRSAPIEALVICRVSDAGAVGVRTAGRAEALRAVAPSSLLGIHGRRTDSLERLSRLIERVPCYRLDLGGELAPAIAAVEGLLARGA
jgi:hypothetical protein